MTLHQIFKLRKGTDLASFEGERESGMTSPGIWKENIVAYLKVISCNLPAKRCGTTEDNYEIVT